MKENNDIILLKLGGSLLTEKNNPLSIREEVVKHAIQQIIDADEKIILIHGGGSFGHPIAKKYQISQGLNSTISNQILGLSETHNAMINLNSYLVNQFLEKKYPILSIQPSSIYLKDSKTIIDNSIEVIETALDLDILPILYGDIILDKQGSFSIISGDQIIFELCKNLRRYRVLKVIFATETDGIFIKVKESKGLVIELAKKIHPNELESLDLADLGQKIDVTGGIIGKIDSIKKISELSIPIQLVNGLKEMYIYESLKNIDINSTHIISN
ncbi:MAG: isopentenyl phosphate kinase [Promethearchaeota archaeon]